MRQYVCGLISCAGLAGVVVALICAAGCENAELNGEGALAIAPATTTFATSNQVVTLTVSAVDAEAQTIFQPLSWSVSDASLGDVVSTAGLTAIYRGTSKKGSNVITVRDREDAIGTAVVAQDW